MSDSRLLRGTFILTAATFISKFLGMIYIFPFYAMIDEKGTALYTYAYLPYSILISVATMGVPLAVSKFISKHNALGDYQTGRRMFRSGLLLMLFTGFLAFLTLYAIAPYLAPLIVGDNPVGNTKEDITYVLRLVSVALLIVPMMSLVRGFFQGHQQMEPTAISQVIEQIIRIIFILIGTFLVLKVFNGEIKTAVGLSTFAAFIGALGGMGVLIWFWIKRKKEFNDLLENSKKESSYSLQEMYKELLTYAGPFVFVGLAIPLYQVIDQFTFNRAMVSIGKEQVAETAFATLHFSSHKLVMIPVSLATAFTLTLIPTITKSFTDGDEKLLHKQITQTLQVVMFLILPAVIGLATLSYPAYAAFFDSESAMALGGMILRGYAPVALLFALFTVTCAILQGINKQRYAVYSLFAGLLLKLIFNVPFIHLFAESGSIVATALGYVCSVAINLCLIKKYADYQYNIVFKRSLLIGIFVGAMSIVVLITQGFLSLFLSYDANRFQAMLILIVSVLVGVAFYFWLGIRSNLVSKILGERFTFLKRKKVKG